MKQKLRKYIFFWFFFNFSKKGIPDEGNYGFQHPDAPSTAPLIDLSQRIGILGVTALRMVKKETLKPLIAKESSDSKKKNFFFDFSWTFFVFLKN